MSFICYAKTDRHEWDFEYMIEGRNRFVNSLMGSDARCLYLLTSRDYYGVRNYSQMTIYFHKRNKLIEVNKYKSLEKGR